ncbi:MAG: phage tail sheath family protein [Nitrosospira sp.]
MDSGAYLRAARTAAYRTPGVYYETRGEARAQPIFRTGIPLFVGFAQPMRDGPRASKACHIDRWQQFVQLYEPLPDSYLGYAVRGFFENGGECCAIVAVQCNQNSPAEMTRALISVFEGNALDNSDGIDLVCVPDAMLPAIRVDHDAVRGIQAAVLDHCHRMGDRFAILDGFNNEESNKHLAPEGSKRNTEPPILHWQSLPRQHGAFGALYYPWISVRKSFVAEDSEISRRTGMPCDEMIRRADIGTAFLNSHHTQFVPPSGHLAGTYARADVRTGVHKAPANEILEGVLKLELDFSDDEQEPLNEAGVNCLRSFAGRGTRVWGARTLSGQPDGLYVNVRRLILTLTRWIRQNMNDLVYEGNSPFLWERVSQRLSAHCRDLFDRGALMGNSPAEAFFVKCDAETNTLESREAGQVVALVGLAPAIPAEFVVVRITQSASATAVTGLNVS